MRNVFGIVLFINVKLWRIGQVITKKTKIKLTTTKTTSFQCIVATKKPLQWLSSLLLHVELVSN